MCPLHGGLPNYTILRIKHATKNTQPITQQLHLRFWACSSQHHPTNCTSKKKKKKHPYPMAFMYFRSLLLSPPKSSLQSAIESIETWKLIMSWAIGQSFGVCGCCRCLPKRPGNSLACFILRAIISGVAWRSGILKPPHIGRSYQSIPIPDIFF